MTVVASMTAADIDLSRTGAEGAKLLKSFLDYAERGPEALPAAARRRSPLPKTLSFEQAVADELVRRGLTVQRQVGCGGYTVDIAVVDPKRNGAVHSGCGMRRGHVSLRRDRPRP